MIKNIFLLLLIISGLSSKGLAQDMVADSFSAKNFSGIRQAQNGQVSFYYCLYSDKEKTYLRAEVIGNDFKPFAKIKHPVNKSTVILSGTYTDRGYCFLLGDLTARTRTLMIIALDGKVMTEKKEENIPAELLSTSLPYYAFSTMPQGIMTVVPTNIKTGSCKFTKYDERMNSTWTLDLTADNGNLTVVSIEQAMERMLLICKESSKDNYEYKVKTLNVQLGKITKEYTLKDEKDNYLFPLYFNVKDGIMLTAGQYYKDGRYDNNKMGGVMGMTVGPNGDIIKKIRIPYDQLIKFMPESKVNELNNGAKIEVVGAYLVQQNNINLVCEIFSKNNSSQDAIVKASDMFIINSNDESEFTGVKMVPGISDHIAKIKGEDAKLNTVATAEMLYKKHFFHYRFAIDAAINSYIGYNNLDSGVIKSNIVLADSVNSSNIKEIPPIPTSLPRVEKTQDGYVYDITPAELPQWQYYDVFKTGMTNTVQMYSIMPNIMIIKRLPADFIR